MRKTVGSLVVSLALGLCLLLISPPGVFSQDLVIDDQTASTVGQMVSFTVRIDTAPTALQAYGFTITYDPNILQYDSFTRGELVENAIFEVNPGMVGSIQTGGITLEGSEGTGFSFEPIAQGTSGILVELNFTVLRLEATTLTITDPVDDLAQGWTFRDGSLMVGAGMPGTRGDCNGSGTVTAFDISAFVQEFFDGDNNSDASAAPGGSFRGDPVGCDADGNGRLTAFDISCIVRIFFNLSCQ